MHRRQRSLSALGVNYSTLFHSGLCAVSSHIRSLSTPAATDSTQSASHPSSSSRTSFRNHRRRSTEGVTSPLAEVPSTSRSNTSSESLIEEIEERDVLMIKGVPLRLKPSHHLNHVRNTTSPSELVSLDPLAPSPRPIAPSFFIDLSDAGSNTDTSPSMIQSDQDESFLSLSASSGIVHPYTRGSPLSSKSISHTSSRLSIHTSIESGNDNSWLCDLDSESLSEFDYDALPKSAVEAPVYDRDGVDDDWRQFHVDWIRDDGAPFSPANSTL